MLNQPADAAYNPTVITLRITVNDIIAATGEHYASWRIERVSRTRRLGVRRANGEPDGYVLLHNGQRVFPKPMTAPKLYPLMRDMLAKLDTVQLTPKAVTTAEQQIKAEAAEYERRRPNKGAKVRKPDSILNQPDAEPEQWEIEAQK